MIRPALAADVERIAEIHVNGWRHAYRGLVSDQYLFGTLKVIRRIEAFREIVSSPYPGEETVVFVDEGIIKAFMTMGDCRDVDKLQTYEVWGIYVEPQFKQQGIGTQLMNHAESRARALERDEIVVWVFKKNQPSIGFYANLGYVPDGCEKLFEAYQETAIRLCKSLS